MTPSAAILVEGLSDKRAVETLAERRGRDLEAEGVAVIAMGGATNIAAYLHRLGPSGLSLRLAGLCDFGEMDAFRRGLERAGIAVARSREEMEALGFHVCVMDLEDELIRALGAAVVEQIVDAQGDLGRFRSLQKQPAWQGQPTHQQLRRFMGSGGSRKIRYASLLVEGLDLEKVPEPLDAVLDRVNAAQRG